MQPEHGDGRLARWGFERARRASLTVCNSMQALRSTAPFFSSHPISLKSDIDILYSGRILSNEIGCQGPLCSPVLLGPSLEAHERRK